jgi:hypothetical protein
MSAGRKRRLNSELEPEFIALEWIGSDDYTYDELLNRCLKRIQTCLLAARDASTQSWNQNS